jgi:hypothetical protein
VIEPIGGMPPGTLGFRVSGTVDRDAYAGVMLPALHDAIERHGTLRTLHQFGPDLHEFDPRALWEDVKHVNTLGMEHLNLVERTAVSSDEAWVRKAAGRFGWLAPGSFKLFALHELEAAKAWLAGPGR